MAYKKAWKLLEARLEKSELQDKKEFEALMTRSLHDAWEAVDSGKRLHEILREDEERQVK